MPFRHPSLVTRLLEAQAKLKKVQRELISLETRIPPANTELEEELETKHTRHNWLRVRTLRAKLNRLSNRREKLRGEEARLLLHLLALGGHEAIAPFLAEEEDPDDLDNEILDPAA